MMTDKMSENFLAILFELLCKLKGRKLIKNNFFGRNIPTDFGLFISCIPRGYEITRRSALKEYKIN